VEVGVGEDEEVVLGTSAMNAPVLEISLEDVDVDDGGGGGGAAISTPFPLPLPSSMEEEVVWEEETSEEELLDAGSAPFG
jgi:hypothetical protein